MQVKECLHCKRPFRASKDSVMCCSIGCENKRRGTKRLYNGKKLIENKREEIIKLFENGMTRVEIANLLGVSYKALTLQLKEWKLEHLKNQGSKGYVYFSKRKPVDRHFSISEKKKGTGFKYELFRKGIKQEKCEICGIKDWMGKSLSLHLDHINGNNKDNRLENLRILCPNCHSQTDTYCGKNVKLKRIAREKD